VNDDGSRSVSRRTNKLRLIGLLSLAGLAGCILFDLKTASSPSKERLSEIKKSVAQLRGLTPKGDFQIDAPGSYPLRLAPSPDDTGTLDAIPIGQLGNAYKQLGLFDARDDVKSALGNFHRLERLIAYDGASNRLLIAVEGAILAAPLEARYGRATTELPLAMGIVQVLQEQHFQWQAKINSTVIEDTRLTYRAIAGSDALLTALALVNDGNLAEPSHLAAAWQVSLQMDKLARDLPPFLRNQLILPFREGSDFVVWAAKAKGPIGMNALYAHPPYATAQILHPEKYYLTAQTPKRFFPAGLLLQMEMPAIFEQSIGEYSLRGLLETEHSFATASQIAGGWRGDQLFSFDNKDFQTTAWYSAWGSPAEAAEFQRAFQTVAEKRQHMRLRAGIDETLIANTRDHGSFALARKNNIVLYLAASTARLGATAEAAWKDLVVEAEPKILRFDFARGATQLSLSKR